MRYFFLLACCAAAFGAGWYFHPVIKKSMDDRIAQRSIDEAADAERLRQEGEQRALAKAAAPPPPENSAATMLDQLKGRPTLATAAPTTSQEPPSEATAAPALPIDAAEQKYPLPTFKTVEEITKDWGSLPSKVFPAKIKTKVPLDFDAGTGKVSLPAGSDALAIGMIQGMLIVSPQGIEARKSVPLGNTDLKDTLTEKYERWKQKRSAEVLSQRDLYRQQLAGASPEQMEAAGPKPEQDSNGVIQIVLQHLKSRGLKDIRAENIDSWGNLAYQTIDGQPCWTVTLAVTVENDIFGATPSECMAIIKDGKVLKLIYTGSREEVS